jgi:hypothetical protein
MSTSGSTDFSLNRDTLIKDSLIDLGAISSEDTPSSAIVEHASRLLNMMLKAWMADGLHLWKIKPFTILLENAKSVYSLSLTGDQASLNMLDTTMRIAGVTNDTILQITTTVGMTAGDYIGIELDNNTLHKTTIASVTDLDTVVITLGITSASAIGNRIYWYTTKVPKPLAVDHITVVDSTDNSRPITIISREEYRSLSNKLATGSVIQVYFDPQLTSSKLYVYNVPNTVDKVLELTGYFPVEDMDSAANDFDIPQEWYLAVKTNLSVLLGPSYGQRSEQMKSLKAIAMEEKERVMGWDKEKTSIFFGVEN